MVLYGKEVIVGSIFDAKIIFVKFRDFQVFEPYQRSTVHKISNVPEFIHTKKGNEAINMNKKLFCMAYPKGE